MSPALAKRSKPETEDEQNRCHPNRDRTREGGLTFKRQPMDSGGQHRERLQGYHQTEQQHQ